MTSKLRDVAIPTIVPKTKHQEIMLCIESTNETLSNLIELMKACCKHCFYYNECEGPRIDSL